jgi:hypothetical protein
MPRISGAVLISLWLSACDDAAAPHASNDAGTQQRRDAGHDHTMQAGAAAMHVDASSQGMPGALRDAGGHAADAGRREDAGRGDAGSTPHDAGMTIDARPATHDAGDASIAAHAPDVVFDDPMFFSLPIDSIRYGVSGHDAEHDLCISVIWYISGIDRSRFCGDDAMPITPDVVIEAGMPAGCWDYRGNADLLAMRGCVDFGTFRDLDDDAVDLDVDVHSDLFTGTVRFKK